jgi:hypothetical protein
VDNPEKEHVVIFALGIIFHGRSSGNNMIQLMLGGFLHANGVRPEVLTQLSRSGLTVGLEGMQRIATILAQHQQNILLGAGKPNQSELRLVYNNAKADRRGLSELVYAAWQSILDITYQSSGVID